MSDVKYAIEKGVALPDYYRVSTYPFGDMEVGDSFFVPFGDEDLNSISTRVHSAVGQRNRREKRKFTTRRVSGGMRVWRIA